MSQTKNRSIDAWVSRADWARGWLPAGLLLVWSGFVAMEVARDWYYLSAAQRSFSIRPHLLQSMLIYYPWFGFSLILGWICHRLPLARTRRSLTIHVPVAVAAGLIHLLIVVGSIALFFPWRIGPDQFAMAYVGHFFQWFHFELLVYAAVALAWTAARPAESTPVSYRQQLMGKIEDENHLVNVTAVEWLEADDNYVIAHTADRKIRMRTTLKLLEDELNPAQFLRVHRSALVNLRSIRRIQGSRIETTSGLRPPCSRAGRQRLERTLD